MAGVAEAGARPGTRSLFAVVPAGRRAWLAVGLVAACLALGALSLVVPGGPSYDPWAWIVWGREVMLGDLRTVGGPSWKPLPVLFTAPFSLFGDAAPTLWMIVARAALFAAVLAAASIGYRLAGAAGAVAAGLLLPMSEWLLRPVLVGNSEAILIFALLAAVDRHLAGRHGQAFAFGVTAGLVRAEAWPFLLVYALWLVVRERDRLPWVLAGLALLPALWLLPDLWGAGSLSRGADRAQQPSPDAPAFTARPAWTIVRNAVDLTPAVVFLGLAAGAADVLLRRAPREAVRPALGIAVLGIAWLALVAAMTEFGFSGITRYLLAPAALAHVLAGVGIGWAVRALWATRVRGRRAAAVALAAVACVGAVAALGGFGSALDYGERHSAVADELDVAIARAGGEQRLEDCGRLYATLATTPMVAWTFDRHLDEVTVPGHAPGVVLRAPAMTLEGAEPQRDALAGAHEARLLARTPYWEVEAACGTP